MRRNLAGSYESLMLFIQLLNDLGNNWKDVTLLPCSALTSTDRNGAVVLTRCVLAGVGGVLVDNAFHLWLFYDPAQLATCWRAFLRVGCPGLRRSAPRP